MSITEEEVKRIAKLSKLKIDGERLQYFTGQLNQILGFVGQLQKVDCTNVEALTSVHQNELYMRADVEVEAKNEDLFANVPGREKELAKEIKYYIVPKVIE